MKLKLRKTKLKNLSNDMKAIPLDLTPQIGGAGPPNTSDGHNCETIDNCDNPTRRPSNGFCIG